MKHSRVFAALTASFLALSLLQVRHAHAEDIDPRDQGITVQSSTIPCHPWNNAEEMGQIVPFASRSAETIQCAPTRLFVPIRYYVKGSTTHINLKRFTIKKGKRTYEPGGHAWFIERDHAGHLGSYWKLKEPNGDRRLSLRKDGQIVTKKDGMTPHFRLVSE